LHFLVTGGGGFIGCHLCRALIWGGNTVTVLDLMTEPAEYKLENIAQLCRYPQVEFLRGSLLDAALCRRAAAGADGVFHLAALAGVPSSVSDPERYYEVNVHGTAALLTALRERPVPVVLASSSSVYGTAENVESAFPRPLSPYAHTKYTAEQLLSLYCAFHDAGGAACRLFSVYGPGMRPDLALRRFACCIHSGRPIAVYGRCRRDYTHVSDTVRGLLLAMEKARQGSFDVYNIGCGSSTDTQALLHLLEAHMGKPARFHLAERRSFDPERTCAHTKKAQEALGFTAQISLEEGVADFVRWFLG